MRGRMVTFIPLSKVYELNRNKMEEIVFIFGNPTILIIFLTFLLFKSFPPKGINSWYGYRTPRSMKNQKRWNFAQKYSANMFFRDAFGLLIIQIALKIGFPQEYYIDLGLLLLWLILSVIIIYKTETKLKKMD